MLLHSVINAAFLIAILQGVKPYRLLSRCHSTFHVSNDGPVALDLPITIFARLDCADNQTDLLYVFEDDMHRVIETEGNGNASATFVFSEGLGRHAVQVTVYLLHPPQFEVAAGVTDFQVQEYIPGTLNFAGIVEDKSGQMYVGTGWSINISLQLQVPPRILKASEFAYSWTIEGHRFTTDRPYLTHSFGTPGRQLVRVSTVGRVPSYGSKRSFLYRWGYFDGDIIVRDSFSNINISGNTYLEHGQLLDLHISCNGSGPIEYCWKILPQTENYTNLTCTAPVIGSECSFPILYYFRDSGDFLLAIYVSNMITIMQRNVEVHIYDVSLRPQLSTVFIPVICTVLVVVIIAWALVIHMRRHTRYDIETADFDFMKNEETSKVAVETSWEVMRRSILHLLQIHRLCYSSDVSASSSNYGSILVGKEK